MALAVSLAAAAGMARMEAATPPAAKTATASPQQLQRGRYLVESVMHCYGCHSEVDWKAGAVPRPGKKGSGAHIPDDNLPFRVVAPNISPDRRHGIGSYSDAELANAIRNGIGKDGRVLFPLMPYMTFRPISDEDLAAVIAYVRAQRPIASAAPKTELPPPVKQLLHAPPPMTSSRPDLSTPVKRGEYLAGLGNCAGCHTPIDVKTLRPILPLAFGGGQALHGPWGKVSSANITPDPSGISYYDEKLFLQMMRRGHVGARRLNPIMLTSYYRRMTDNDLRDLFAYLKSLPPVKHRVDNTEPPTPCKLCNGVHGLGDQN
jgi:mono/diheme cytochrome c family protein